MAGSLPIDITNRKISTRGYQWALFALWTLLLIYWVREVNWLWVAICIVNLVLLLRRDKSSALQRIAEVSLDDQSLTIARTDGSSFSIPASRISSAAANDRRIEIAYRQNEEQLTQKFKRSDFDATAWADLQLLAARFPGG
jgi:hypothetical protein